MSDLFLQLLLFQYNIAAPENDEDCEEENEDDEEYGGGSKKKEDLESDDPVERKIFIPKICVKCDSHRP